jgi:dolichol-phosphate mannosyltransferase
MSRVTLIVPAAPGRAPERAALLEIRDALGAAGHAVEILLLSGDPTARPPEDLPGTRVLDVGEADLAGAVLLGIEGAQGDRALVLDPRVRYPLADLLAVLEALDEGRGDVVVASRRCAWRTGADGRRVARPSLPLGPIFRWFAGSSDPLSALVGVRCDRIDARRHVGRAVGSMFTLELLAQLPGDRADVPARPLSPPPPFRPSLDELRHIKHLADDRYGNFSRLVQFCLVGASGMVVDLTSYTLFQEVFKRSPLHGRTLPLLGDLDLVAAGAMAVGLALTWNFTLNRRLTFSYARRESRRKQFAAYVLSNALAVTVNLFLRLYLPNRVPFFDRHRLLAAVVGIVLATGLSFSMARWFVFRRRVEAEAPPLAGPEDDAGPGPGPGPAPQGGAAPPVADPEDARRPERRPTPPLHSA